MDFCHWQVKAKLCFRKPAHHALVILTPTQAGCCLRTHCNPVTSACSRPRPGAGALGDAMEGRGLQVPGGLGLGQSGEADEEKRSGLQCVCVCGGVPRGTVGVLAGQTFNFAWGKSGMGSQEMTLELGCGGTQGVCQVAKQQQGCIPGRQDGTCKGRDGPTGPGEEAGCLAWLPLRAPGCQPLSVPIMGHKCLPDQRRDGQEATSTGPSLYHLLLPA